MRTAQRGRAAVRPTPRPDPTCWRTATVARISAGTLIAGLVAAALIAVGALAVDASWSAPDASGSAAAPGYPLAAAGTSGAGATRSAAAGAPGEARQQDARGLPADS